jgi:hypothetical protein
VHCIGAHHGGCPKCCHKYSKSFEEIIKACNKQREGVLALKDISENQKEKISSLREEKNNLLDKVDKMELDAKKESELILRMTRDTRDLKIELRDLRMILIEKDEVIFEKSEKSDNMDDLKTKLKDLEDELIQKDIEISKLELRVKETLNLEHLESELNLAAKGEDDLKVKITSLEEALKLSNAKETADKVKRKDLFKKMDVITEARQSELKSLTEKLKNQTPNPFSKCWYGIFCYSVNLITVMFSPRSTRALKSMKTN